MMYKSKNIEFLTNDTKVSNLCYYDGFYYFESQQEIESAETVTEEEFAKAVDSIVYVEPTPTEPQPTQLDGIEETQLIMMEAMVDQYEQQLEQDLINMEAQATIYEAVLALGGEM